MRFVCIRNKPLVFDCDEEPASNIPTFRRAIGNLSCNLLLSHVLSLAAGWAPWWLLRPYCWLWVSGTWRTRPTLHQRSAPITPSVNIFRRDHHGATAGPTHVLPWFCTPIWNARIARATTRHSRHGLISTLRRTCNGTTCHSPCMNRLRHDKRALPNAPAKPKVIGGSGKQSPGSINTPEATARAYLITSRTHRSRQPCKPA